MGSKKEIRAFCSRRAGRGSGPGAPIVPARLRVRADGSGPEAFAGVNVAGEGGYAEAGVIGYVERLGLDSRATRPFSEGVEREGAVRRPIDVTCPDNDDVDVLIDGRRAPAGRIVLDCD